MTKKAKRLEHLVYDRNRRVYLISGTNRRFSPEKLVPLGNVEKVPKKEMKFESMKKRVTDYALKHGIRAYGFTSGEESIKSYNGPAHSQIYYHVHFFKKK